MNLFAIQFGGWADRHGNVWKGGVGNRAEPGWLFCLTIPGTICWERGRWACYRNPVQTEPCAIFDHLHEAGHFMLEGHA